MKICVRLFLFFTLLFSSCNYIPCSASSDLTAVKSVPANDQLAGIYKPDSFTKEDIPGYSNSDSPYLELTKEGIAYFKGFAKSTFAFEDNVKDTGIKVNGDGTWQCCYQKNAAFISTQLQFSNSPVVSMNTFMLYKKNDKFVILLPVGDPDICTALRLFQQ